MRRIAPLNALRAFEAAARHLSFSKAADELHVTPAAISHQIKALEDYVGAPLFRRLTRALLLTEEGQSALPLLRDGFDRLEQATEAMAPREAIGTLTVSVAPTIAGMWLVPRLDRFVSDHPEITVRIDATNVVADFDRDDVDVSIRFGDGRYRGMRVDRLAGEEVFPVCGPTLLAGARPLREPADLAGHTLLHIDWGVAEELAPTWRMWLMAAGVEGVDAGRGPRFTVSSMAYQAAAQGHGVALGSALLVAGELAAGRLVKPFDLSVTGVAEFGYWVVCPEATADRPKVAAFRHWVLQEMAESQSALVPANG